MVESGNGIMPRNFLSLQSDVVMYQILCRTCFVPEYIRSKNQLRTTPTVTADNTVTLSLAGLSRGMIVAVRKETCARTNSDENHVRVEAIEKQRSCVDSNPQLEERLTVMRATELDSRSDWLIFQVLEAVRWY